MNLTEYFYLLPKIDYPYNKYATYSLKFGNPYRLCTSIDAFKYKGFDSYLKNFLAEQGKCIAMPSMINDEVIAILFRSISTKSFRYYSECPNIPYGAGSNNKFDYYKPWIIVESALDSDFLRNFYPYVLSTNGVTVSRNTMSFIKGTCSTCFCGFDFDKAGCDSFHWLSKNHSGSEKDFHLKRFYTPTDFDGNHLKDFGDVIELLHLNNLSDYDYYVSEIKNSLLYI